MAERPDGLAFKEPAKGRNVTFSVLPIGKLEVITHQRKVSDPHVKRVVDSIERVGFLTPLVVIEREGGDGWVVIDGQHRLLAARELGLRRVPAMIVPHDLGRRMLALNVEKEPNIRERAGVALSVYREIVEAQPTLKENDAEVKEAVHQAHYVTLGLAYAENGRLAGSLYEPVLKKCDTYLRRSIADSLPVREERATRVAEAHKLVRAVAAGLKEHGVTHDFVNNQIISAANPIKRTRKQHPFDETFDKLLAKLRDFEAHPTKVLRGGR
jgi:ParB family chromosome partitioning protein